MNERFWELVEQADEEGGDDPDIRDEVFGKLLIQECATIADQRPTVLIDQTTGGLIKQHFGVEE